MTTLASRFNRDTDDWTIAGDVNVFEWRGSGGTPGGHLYWEDAAAGAVSYWTAPVKFTGDQSDFRGGKLSFEWYSSGSGYLDGDVLLTGGNGVTLVADAPEPGADWSRVSIALNGNGGWHVGSLSGPVATSREVAAVLRDVAQIQVRAEHVNGPETGGFDNFMLRSRPAPSTLDMAAVFGEDAADRAGWIAAAPAHAIDPLHLALV